MKLKYVFAFLILSPSICCALPTESEFKALKSNRTAKIENCAVTGVDGAVTIGIKLDSKRPLVSLPNSLKRQSLKIGAKGDKFAACGVSDLDSTKIVVFLKNKLNDTTATEVQLDLSDFEKLGDVGSACKSIKPWSNNFIYKTVGSHHFTDIRRNTIGLIMTFGANVPTPSCIDIISSNGTKIGDFGFYSRGAGWFARYYGGVGCGDPINGQSLGNRARAAGGNTSIYARIGSVCYGPIDATRCVGSKAC